MSSSRSPITRHSWSIDESAFGFQLNSPSPTFKHVFGAASYSVGPYQGPLTNSDGLFDYHLFRPPATVTLKITDSAGRTASVSHTITFRNPDEPIVGLVRIDPDTGLPDFSRVDFVRDARFLNFKLCDSRMAKRVNLRGTASKLGRAAFRSGSAVLMPFGSGAGRAAAVTVKSPCPSGLMNCFGELVVGQLPRLGAGHRRGAMRVLGRTAFFVAPGHTATVTVRLNSRGTALARAQRLRTVILQLTTGRASGKAARTSSTVRLRRQR